MKASEFEYERAMELAHGLPDKMRLRLQHLCHQFSQRILHTHTRTRARTHAHTHTFK